MLTPGQPTLYKPECIELAHNYCLLGATNETPGDSFGVTPRTIRNWIATHADFVNAVYRGGRVADGVIVRALFDRAKDLSRKVTRTAIYKGEEPIVTNAVFYPPDTQACMLWLRNRQPEYWQARAEAPPELEVSHDDLAAMVGH